MSAGTDSRAPSVMMTPGRDAYGADALASVLRGDATGEGIDRALGRPVHRAAMGREDRVGGAGVDHDPVALADHGRDRVLGAEGVADQVHP